MSPAGSKPETETVEDFSGDQCGECLDLPTGPVCTVQGTMRNSCLAICRSSKILCTGECPCEDKQEAEPARE